MVENGPSKKAHEQVYDPRRGQIARAFRRKSATFARNSQSKIAIASAGNSQPEIAMILCLRVCRKSQRFLACDENSQSQSQKSRGFGALTSELNIQFPFFSTDKRPEFRRRRIFMNPFLVSAMTQALSFHIQTLSDNKVRHFPRTVIHFHALSAPKIAIANQCVFKSRVANRNSSCKVQRKIADKSQN